MFIAVYNLLYTSMPVLALGVFEQDVNAQNSVAYPKLYTPGIHNRLFNKLEFLRSSFHGFIASGVLFFIPYGELVSLREAVLTREYPACNMRLLSLLTPVLILGTKLHSYLSNVLERNVTYKSVLDGSFNNSRALALEYSHPSIP